jgi:hypothetical protein
VRRSVEDWPESYRLLTAWCFKISPDELIDLQELGVDHYVGLCLRAAAKARKLYRQYAANSAELDADPVFHTVSARLALTTADVVATALLDLAAWLDRQAEGVEA